MIKNCAILLLCLAIAFGLFSCNDDLLLKRNHAVIILKNNSDQNISCMFPDQFLDSYAYWHGYGFSGAFAFAVLDHDTTFFRNIMVTAHNTDTIADYYTNYDLEYKLNTQVYLLNYDTIIYKQFANTIYLNENVFIAEVSLTYNSLHENKWTFSYP